MIRIALVALAIASAACSTSPTDPVIGLPTPRPTADPSAPPGATPSPAPTVQVVFGASSVTAEVAATPSERAQGLMNRSSLPQDAGMLFLFPNRHRGGFWMKNTLIPLSIAFMQRQGEVYTVVDVLDMEPCSADPCQVYTPDNDYDVALEVNKGWFAGAGVGDGSTAAVLGVLPPAS